MGKREFRVGQLLFVLAAAAGAGDRALAQQCAPAQGLSAPVRDVTVVAGGKVYRDTAGKPHSAGTRLRWSIPSNGFANYNGNNSGYHPAEDWNLDYQVPQNDLGEPVYAIGNGVVEKVSNLSKLGWLVAVRHDAPAGSSFSVPADRGSNYSYTASQVASLFAIYIHISGNQQPPAGVVAEHPQRPPLAVGQCVSAATVLGYVLNPGLGPHLHFELRKDPGAKALPRQLGVVRADWFGVNWSMVQPSTNWPDPAKPNGYYKEPQRMVDSGFWRGQSVVAANPRSVPETAAQMMSPTPNSILAGGSVLQWSTGSSVRQYWLDLCCFADGRRVYPRASQGLKTSFSLPNTGLPEDGRTLTVTLQTEYLSGRVESRTYFYLAPQRGNRWEVRVFNSDDIGRVRINGTLVPSLTMYFKQDSGYRDITASLRPGTNHLVFEIENSGGGMAYGFQVRKNGALFPTQSCGTAGVVGCDGNRVFPSGFVRTFFLDIVK